MPTESGGTCSYASGRLAIALTCSPALCANADEPDVGRLRVERHVHQLGHVVRDGREPLQPVGGDGLDPHLQGEVRDDRGEVAVAGALAVAVDGALHLDGAAADAGERVGHAGAGVVVEVDGDADVATEVRDHLADDVLDLVRAGVPPFVSHSTRRVAPACAAPSRTRMENSGLRR